MNGSDDSVEPYDKQMLKEIEERIKQAMENRIFHKATIVVEELGKYSKWPSPFKKRFEIDYVGEGLHIIGSARKWPGYPKNLESMFGFDFYDSTIIIHDPDRKLVFESKTKTVKEYRNGNIVNRREITAYIPGDWAEALDRAYQPIMKRRQEERDRKNHELFVREQQKQKEVLEEKLRRFGLA